MRTKHCIIMVMFGLFFLCLSAAANILPTVDPEEVGISGKRLAVVRPLILEGIEKWEYPGAVLVVGRKGKIVFREAFGYFQWFPEERVMDVNSIFDLASVTKPVATATSIMILVEKGKLRLWDKVRSFIPGFQAYITDETDSGKDARIWHLLTHTSGLPPYTEVGGVLQKYGDPCSPDDLVRYIAELEKTNAPGAEFHYSCLGYITLAAVIKQLTGISVADYAEKNIFLPLRMRTTFYNPPDRFRNRCVPTEYFGKNPLQGIVHDPLARLQGGVSGNAGLFSTADDLAVFAQMILNKGKIRGRRILSPLTVERMTEIFPRVFFAGRGLGWDLDSAYSTNGGDLFGAESFGHTGYTGTSVCIDPKTETFVILLTNRVHPDDKGSVISLRSKVANIVAASIIER